MRSRPSAFIRFLCPCLFVLPVLLAPVNARAAKAPDYTLPLKNLTVLQGVPDRDLAPARLPERRGLTPGESPVTGLPWQGAYRPMLVQIGNAVGKVKTPGKTVKTAGVGAYAPWGAQDADILYESALTDRGATRFTMLFQDCFAASEPVDSVGPVRSVRRGALYLRAEWQASLVYSGGYLGMFGWRDRYTPVVMEQTGSTQAGAMFNLLSAAYQAERNRVKGVKAPSNLNVNLQALAARIPESFASQPRAFCFADESPYGQAYARADTVHLDWGEPTSISHLVYDATQNAYLRYCGPGVKPQNWLVFQSFVSAEDRDPAHAVTLAFANVIVQRVPPETQTADGTEPHPQQIGQGNADIFIGGRYIPGYWVCPSPQSPTVYFDDHGEELVLLRGKTYVAQFPEAAVCAISQGD